MARSDEVAFYGVHASLAIAAHRPNEILRVFHAPSRRMVVGPLLKQMAAWRKPYREVIDEELGRIARTMHHEGVVVVARPLRVGSIRALAEQADANALIVALDTVGNPHNLGAILRTAAYFGGTAVLVSNRAEQANLSPAAARIAQGAAETVPCFGAPELGDALQMLSERGVRVVGTDHRARRSMAAERLKRPVCLVLGNEQTGLSPDVRKLCDPIISIPGAARPDGETAVESLNVSVAAGILLAAVTPRGAGAEPKRRAEASARTAGRPPRRHRT